MNFFFYCFSLLAIISAVFVICTKNPVHSVLSLISAFISSAVLFILLGAELVAMVMVIVYVGAVAVLFLFVVMMLDIDYVRLRQGFVKYSFMGVVCSSAFLFSAWYTIKKSKSLIVQVTHDNVSNVAAIGNVLYTDYMYAFHLSGILLLVAIVGAIALTLRNREGVRKQSLSKQLMQSSSLKIVKVKTKEGIEWKS